MKLARYLGIAIVAYLTVVSNAAGQTPESEIPKFTVENGKVDKGTYNGYRRFHGVCHACHGQDAMGGSFAPALVESLKRIDYDTFVKTVMEGRQSTDASGAVTAMPSFKDDPNVTKYLDDIYRYLSARASGELPPGRPTKIP